MRVPVITAALAIACALAPAARQESPFFPVAIEYSADGQTTRVEIARDLQAVRASGFNTIKTVVRWRESEPLRGEILLGALERTLEIAGQSGLRAIVQIDNAAPEWIFTRYADGARRTEPAAPSRQACLDHPGVRADLLRFIGAVAKTSARYPALLAVDTGSPPPAGLCLCPHTAARVKALSGVARQDAAAVVRMLLRDDLAALARAASASGVQSASHAALPSVVRGAMNAPLAQDDWLMSAAIDRYGTTIDGATSPARLSLAADAIAGATRRMGWWLDLAASVPDRDRRLAAWTAVARGARGLVFDDPPPDSGFVGTIARNPALFNQLRPRRSRVALLFDPLEPVRSGNLAAEMHRALFDRHISIDMLHVEELTADTITGYRTIVATSSRPLPIGTADALKSFQAAGGVLVDAADSRVGAAKAVEAIEAAGVTPDVRVDGGSGIEVRFLESPAVQMIVGLNHSGSSQRVTMTFAPETQEAIWQNMETGAGVNFIAGAAGPAYAYWFRPKDALVLMIRKDIR